MQIRELFTDEDAVSPVIGVILMVAITVILAAVIGAFVLGFGDSTSSAPSASFDVEYDDSAPSVTFTHDGGDPITAEHIEASGTNVDTVDKSGISGDEMTAGESITVTLTGTLSTGDSVSLIWNDGDNSATLREYEN